MWTVLVVALTVKLVHGMHGRKCVGMSELNKAWRDIYATFEDNAFDYVGKPFVNDSEGTLTFEGRKYAEVPF
jgi:hypothetical protein